jgi:hypothetical protein
VRQSGMMRQRRVRGLVIAGLLCATLAGCGSVVASQTAAAPVVPATGTTLAPQVGCASVKQATAVSVHQSLHLAEPARAAARVVTQRNAALVRALFGDLCAAVTHPDIPPVPINCPADFGVAYAGTFFDGQRVLATFIYGASGCQRVSLTAAGKTQATMLVGTAAAASPHLQADMAAVLGLPKSELNGAPGNVNPGGPTEQAP